MSYYTQDVTPALAALQGTAADLNTKLAQAEARITAFAAAIRADEKPAFNSALHVPETTRIALNGWQDRFDHVIFLGMGGSSLGGKLIEHFADATHLTKPHLHFVDYLAPCALETLTRELPLAKTGLIAISKSGGTAETMAQLLLLAPAWQKANLPLAEHMLAVTESKASALQAFAEAHHIPVLPHHPQLGGRYSIMGETGTLPALLKGVDMSAVHQGMQTVVAAFLADPIGSAPAQGAALHALALEKGRTLNVLYSYGERFRLIPAWFEQLWAESLGKDGKGTTPLGAVGPSGQHSLQQLFLAGPQDKLFTLILPQSHGWGQPIPAQPFKPELGGITPGSLQQAMGEGTLHSLADRGHPVRTLSVPKLKPENLGALLMHFMLETVLTACLWEVNPFDQPAVEESKIRTLNALESLR